MTESLLPEPGIFIRPWGQAKRDNPVRNLGRRSGYCLRFNPLLASIDSLTSFSLLANAPLGHLSDRSPARLQRVAEARISASKIHFLKFPHFSGFFRFENVHFGKIRSPRHDNAQVFANCLKQ